MRVTASFLIVLGLGCSSDPQSSSNAADAADLGTDPNACPGQATLAVAPSTFAVRAQFAAEAPLTFRFATDRALAGNGVPADINAGDANDLAVAELELPFAATPGATDEGLHLGSTGLRDFDAPRFCTLAEIAGGQCTAQNGLWRACIIRAGTNGCTADSEVQVGRSMRDTTSTGTVYRPVIGVFLPTPASGGPNNTLACGDVLQLTYVGHATGRATDFTSTAMLTHFRYRPSAGPASGDLCSPGGGWITVAEPQPVQVTAGMPAFMHVVAPLDLQAGAPFDVAVVLTDRYGNPVGFVGPVLVQVDDAAAVACAVDNAQPFRCVLAGATVGAAGLHRVAVSLATTMYDGMPIRLVPQWSYAWAGTPQVHRRVGDVHSHSGDGGAQTAFLGAFIPGDHDGLYSRTEDVLRYMDRVAGLDFGAVSEHAARPCDYTPPPAIAADCAFTPTAMGCQNDPAAGLCAPGTHPQNGHTTDAPTPIPGLRATYVAQQMAAVHDYQTQRAGAGFTAFDAYEWHSPQRFAPSASASEIHRVVLWRDLVDPLPGDPPPVPFLPGDLGNLAPQCIQRFLTDFNVGASAMVIPHMMRSSDDNIDWQLTYQDTVNLRVADRATVERLTTVGEVYSARAGDQTYAYGTRGHLTAFEDNANITRACAADGECPSGSCVNQACTPPAGHWTYRWGWQVSDAHVGLIGSSDNHSQFAGVNDEMPAMASTNGDEPVSDNEPGGYAIVLAADDGVPVRNAIFDGMRARRSYATTAVRAYLAYNIDGNTMGTLPPPNQLDGAATATARVTLCAGVPIQRVELWGAKTGGASLDYQLLTSADQVGKECWSNAPGGFSIANPVGKTGAVEEWLYYVRAFLRWPDSSNNLGPDEAVWSSPIWINWQGR